VCAKPVSGKKKKKKKQKEKRKKHNSPLVETPWLHGLAGHQDP